MGHENRLRSVLLSRVQSPPYLEVCSGQPRKSAEIFSDYDITVIPFMGPFR